MEYETITLTKTALTCYAVAEKAGNQVYIPLQVCDADGVPFSSGVPADAMTTLNLDSLPAQISVRTEQNQLILFTAIDEEPCLIVQHYYHLLPPLYIRCKGGYGFCGNRYRDM